MIIYLTAVLYSIKGNFVNEKGKIFCVAAGAFIKEENCIQWFVLKKAEMVKYKFYIQELMVSILIQREAACFCLDISRLPQQNRNCCGRRRIKHSLDFGRIFRIGIIQIIQAFSGP